VSSRLDVAQPALDGLANLAILLEGKPLLEHRASFGATDTPEHLGDGGANGLTAVPRREQARGRIEAGSAGEREGGGGAHGGGVEEGRRIS
jgi:hypothetical protein